MTIVINMTIILYMKKRCYLYLQSILSLFFGFLIYVFFRRGTYIHKFLKISEGVYIETSFLAENLVRYGLPDFLWAYSLSLSLFALFCPKGRGQITIVFTTVLVGCIWEMMQLLGAVSGTFDIYDCLMYAAAAIASYYFYQTKEKQK